MGELITEREIGFLPHPIGAEVKYDGEWNLAVRGSDFYMINKYNTVRRENPFLQDLLRIFGDTEFEIVGELAPRDPMTPFNEFLKLARKGKWDLLEFRIFDVRKFNSTDFSAIPYIERRKFLEKKICGKETEFVKLTEMILSDSPRKTLSFYRNAIDRGYEGVMLKPLQSLSEKAWIKVKPELEMDVVVLGVTKGRQSFLIGVYDNGSIRRIGKVAIPDDRLYCAVKRLAEKYLQGEDDNFLYLPPKLVIQVAYMELIPSKKYDGFSLRFPRFVRIRKDKRASECTVNQIPERLLKKIG